MSRLPSLEQQLKALRQMDRSALVQQYQRLHGKAPASNLDRTALELAVTARLQQHLIARLRSKLYQVLAAAESITSVVADGSADTILVKDWRGSCHEVTIIEAGVIYQGRGYDSLDEVARIITEGQLSGNQFFGAGARHGRDV